MTKDPTAVAFDLGPNQIDSITQATSRPWCISFYIITLCSKHASLTHTVTVFSNVSVCKIDVTSVRLRRCSAFIAKMPRCCALTCCVRATLLTLHILDSLHIHCIY